MRKIITLTMAAILYVGILFVGSADVQALTKAKIILGQKTYQVLEIIN